MRYMRMLCAAVVIATWSPTILQAQRALSFDVRGGYSFPIGDFGDAVESDFGFGAGAVLALTSSVGIYGGWARDSFGCDDLLCADDSQVHVSGFEVGGKFTIPTESRILPWLKAGLIAHKTKFDGEGVEVESDRNYGFQAAAGLDFPLGEVLSVSPGLRFNMLETDDDDFFADPEVRYLSFDIGAHINLPSN